MDYKKINRRNFIKQSALASASLAFTFSKISASTKKVSNLRLGVIGTGLRGQWMTSLCLLRNDVDIKAICDIDPEMINKTLSIIKKGGGKPPDVYKNGQHDFLNLVQRDDLDAVYIATPWAVSYTHLRAHET